MSESAARPGRLSAHLIPGIAAAAVLTLAAFQLRRLPGLDLLTPPILAVTLGMAIRNLAGVPAVLKPGLAVTARFLLRFAVVLLGLQLTAGQALGLGVEGLIVVAVALTATYVLTTRLGALMGVDRPLAALIAAGTSVCGASAIAAANGVVRARDEDVAYAMASITLFGTVSMLLLPALAQPLGLSPATFGLWAGASTHEVAQAVAAAFQQGQAAGEAGTVAKLTRVMLLGPLIVAMGVVAMRRASRAGAGPESGARVVFPVPLFVVGFVAMIALNSLLPIPPQVTAHAATATSFLLAMALAGLGLQTDFAQIRARGLRPLLLGLFSWLFIAGLSLALIELLG